MGERGRRGRRARRARRATDDGDRVGTNDQVIVVESHYAVGGAAHGFARKTREGNLSLTPGRAFSPV